MSHILNRSLAPAPPKQAPTKPTADQAKVVQQLRKTKAAEAVGRAISRRRA